MGKSPVATCPQQGGAYVLTDKGNAFRSRAFRAACAELGIRHKFPRAYRPQTNGKAERFIQSALRQWAYGIAYEHSTERTEMLAKWQQHYNWHRPHAGIGGVPPISRLKPVSGNNLLTLHSWPFELSLALCNARACDQLYWTGAPRTTLTAACSVDEPLPELAKHNQELEVVIVAGCRLHRIDLHANRFVGGEAADRKTMLCRRISARGVGCLDGQDDKRAGLATL